MITMRKLRMWSLCSGIGGADLAAEWTNQIEIYTELASDTSVALSPLFALLFLFPLSQTPPVPSCSERRAARPTDASPTLSGCDSPFLAIWSING